MSTEIESAQSDLRFLSWDGEVEAQTGQGDHCVFIQIKGPGQHAGIVLTDVEAERLGTSLIRRAEYSRSTDGNR